MVDVPKRDQDIQKLINKVMPQLQSFVAGRRGSGDKSEEINDQIVSLRDSLKKLNEADRERFLSQSVHGNNLTGGFFSFLEKNAGLKLSTTLGEAIRRYDDTVLENRPDTKKAATRIQAAFRGHAVRKGSADPVSLVDSTSERSVSPVPIAQARAALPKVDREATIAMLPGEEEFSQDNPMRSNGAGPTPVRRSEGPLSKTEAAKMKMMKAYNKGDIVHIRPDTMDYFPRAKEGFSQENPMYSKAAGPAPVRRSEGHLSKTEAAKMKMMKAYKNDDVVHIRPDTPDTMDYFPRAKEEFSQKNPMYSKAARTTPVRRSEGPLSARDAAKMKMMEAYDKGDVVHIRPDTMDYFPKTEDKEFSQDNPMSSKAARTTPVGKSKTPLSARDAAKMKMMDAYKVHVRPDKPATTKPSEEGAARTIQAGFKERNKLAISALKMKARIDKRTSEGVKELKAAVERTIKENTVKGAGIPNPRGLKKTGRDLKR